MDRTLGKPGTTTMGDTRAVPDDGSPWSYATLLLRRRRLIVGTGMAAALVAGVVSLLTPREHEAKASFVSQESSAVPQGTLGQLASQFGLPLRLSSAPSPQFYADLLVSRTVLRDVLLTEYAVPGPPPFRGDLLAYFRIREEIPSERLSRGLRRLRRAMDVTVASKTGVVEFSVRTKDPDLSVRVANRLLELVNDYNLRRRQTQAREEREFVEGRLAEVRLELAQAEDSLARFSKENRRISDSPELQIEQERLRRQVMLRQQLYLSLAQSFDAAKLEEVRGTPLIMVIDQPDVLVQRLPRRTLLKVAIALVLGALLVAGFTLVTAFVRSAGGREVNGYQEFVHALRDATAGVRRWFGRAA
jgi:uncharacterized protein involved in exopolysaccharide biosynthesis